MKKVLIAHDIRMSLMHDADFLKWKHDVVIFEAASNDEAIAVHRNEHVNLIITQLDMPGMSTEEFCTTIRADAALRSVSIIMVCENEIDAIERSLRCRPNAVLLRPVHPLVLTTKASQLVNVPARGTYHALLSACIDGRPKDETFFCRSCNISAAGVLVETDRVLAEGDRLSCSIPLPDSQHVVQISAKVVRAIEQIHAQEVRQYGLAFTEVSPHVKQMLTEYIIKRSSDSSKS